MKTRLIIIMAVAAIAATAGQPIERLELLDGEVLENAQIRRAGDEGVTVFHAGGIATVAWTNMPKKVIEENDLESEYRDAQQKAYWKKELASQPESKGGIEYRRPAPDIEIVSRGNPPEYADKLKTSLGYLVDIAETRWVQISHNTVYVGMSHLPADAELVAKFAALHGNEAIGFGCHVWVTDGPRGWRPGSRASFRRATARHGKVER
jgi:hypothetical protein